MIVYDDSIFIEVESMMTQLIQYLFGRVRFITQQVASFDQLHQRVIFNCAGAGAARLHTDHNLHPSCTGTPDPATSSESEGTAIYANC